MGYDGGGIGNAARVRREEWVLHELSIAESVIEVASRQADGRRVTKVHMRVGHLRQVVPSSLAFGFGLLAEGTPAEGAELEIEQVPAEGRCRACGRESRLGGFPLSCPGCGNFELEILKGEELMVDSLELEEA
jgi:hydrogenase nickel incorporation protein HypA/HybF